MVQPEILVKGDFGPEDMVVSVGPSNLVILDEVAEDIEQIWSEKLKEAKEKGLNLYNGKSYRLNSFDYTDGKIVLGLGVMDFKTRYGLRFALSNVSFDESMYRNGCFVGGSVRTSDGNYLMVKLSGKSMNNNTYDFLGGMMELEVPMSDAYVFDVMYEELKEEAGIEREEVSEMVLRGVYRDIYTNVGFYMTIQLSLSTKEVLERFSGISDVDIAGIEAYSYDEYVELLRGHNENKQFVLREYIA